MFKNKEPEDYLTISTSKRPVVDSHKKIKAVEQALFDAIPYDKAAKANDLNSKSMNFWIRKYAKAGFEALDKLPGTEEYKRNVLAEYLIEKMPKEEILRNNRLGASELEQYKSVYITAGRDSMASKRGFGPLAGLSDAERRKIRADSFRRGFRHKD